MQGRWGGEPSEVTRLGGGSHGQRQGLTYSVYPALDGRGARALVPILQILVK